MQQIGNVVYNLLNMVGAQNKDERMIGVANELRGLMQSEKFDNLFDDKVPYVGFDKINLLKANEISHEDQAKLMKQGLGDLFRHPSM